MNLISRPSTGAISFWGQNDLFEMGLNASGVNNDVCFWVAGYSFKIGAGVWGPTGNFLNGYVDDVIIYNRELSASEISQGHWLRLVRLLRNSNTLYSTANFI